MPLPRPRALAGLLCSLAIVAAACSAGDGSESSGLAPEEPTVEPSAVPTPSESTPTAEPEATSPPTIALDLAKDPLILFGAVPPMPPGADLPLPDGSEDFFELFAPGAAWTTAAARVDVFKLHSWQVRHFLDDEQLTTILTWLDDHQMPLMFETEPLDPPDPAECDHTESFEGPYDLEMARRIRDLGGTISVVAVEEPFAFAHKLDGPGACRYTVERVVDEVIGYVAEMRDIFPGVPVGSIEPIWKSPETTADDMALWLDTYRERSGEPFAFLHVDPDWTRSDWPQVAAAIEAEADARGVPFGVLYNGGLDTDGPTWLANTMDRIVEFEAEFGATPQHIAFQSWVDQPDRVLPDDDLGAFTSLINRYFGARTRLESSFVDPGDDSNDIVIRLTDDDGNPLAGQSISAGLRPLSGALQTHTVTGTVPAGSRTAVAVVRVNVEDAGPGPADVRLAEVGYEEDGDGTNRVSNADFARGLTDWGAYGEPMGEVRVTSRADGAGSSLALVATPEQVILVDSVPFPVTPGATFELRAVLGVPEASIGNATVAVVFLDEIEITRHSIRLEPLLDQLAPIETDADGNATIPTLDLEPGRYLLDARYAGDLERWPSRISIAVDVPAR